MPQNNEIVTALPAMGDADKELLRAWGVQRNSFNLRADEDLRDFVMVDPDGGGTTPSVVQNGMLYGHDPDDVITDHDGVFCLVSYDSQRYKLEEGLHAPFNVLDKDLTAPISSPAPSYGDAYLIFGSPTGAWAGKSGYIAIFTARGWSFCLPPIGFLVYVRDEKSFYHRDDTGAWTLGTGTRTLGSNSVPLSSAINFGRRVIVENQTTTSPPETVSVGTAYIIGPSATSDWAGKDGKIAICEVADTFTVYSPTIGWAAYDKSQNNEYRYDGSGWVSAVGAVLGYKDVYTAGNGSVTRDTGTGYNYATANFPTSAQDHWDDGINIAGYAARAVGNILVFEYSCLLTAGGSNQAITGGIIRGNEATALAFDRVDFATQTTLARFRFRIVASDTLAKDYRMGFWPNATPASALSSVEHRHFSVTEYLP